MPERPDAIWTQVESLLTLYRAIDGKDALPPLRGWAMSPDLLLHLFGHIRLHRSRTIIECGSGASTIVMAHALRTGSDGSHIYALEHMPRLAEALRQELRRWALARFVTVIEAPLTERRYPGFEHAFHWYDISTANLPDRADLLVVDGPPGNTNPYARYPAGPELLHLLAPGAHVILDDTNRPEEKELATLWRTLRTGLKARELAAEKGALELTFSDVGESVTVLMPVYNGAAYLEAALESIRCQTHRDFELVIVDDGSTDGTGEILQRVAAQDPRLRIVRAPHEGIASARNRGLAVARGSVVVCMDADDIAAPERIERQVAYLGAHPQIAAVGSALRLIGKDGRPMGPPTPYPLASEEIRKGLLMGYSMLAQPTVAMRRQAVLAVGGYRSAFNSAAGDFDLWLRLSERYPLANMPDVLVDYRWHGDNVTVRRRRDQALAAHIARLAARERQLGRPDPTSGLNSLCVADLDRFDLPEEERAAILQELSEAGLVAYDATREAQHLSDVVETLFAQCHPRGDRARAVATRLVPLLWKARERRRSIAVIGWRLRAEMSSVARHAAALVDAANWKGRRAIRDWLVHCADPLGSRSAPPRRALSPQEARELMVQADEHGVLPALLRYFPPFKGDAAFDGAKAEALALHRSKLAYSLMLRTHGDALMAAAAGLPVVMVKGPVFSRTIYPSPGLRNFTDIDLLVPPDAEPQLARVLEHQGFKLAEYDRDPDRQEWKWLHRDNEALMIEVHTNLVHHPELRDAMSVRYQDLAGIAETPAALLTVALVHGALERYELLRHVVDVCQAARRVDTAEEKRRFEALVQQTDTRFAAIAGLDLAYRLFDEPRCRELARGLGPARYAALTRLLLGRSAITSTMSSARQWHSWRRQGFRALLKRSDGLRVKLA